MPPRDRHFCGSLSFELVLDGSFLLRKNPLTHPLFKSETPVETVFGSVQLCTCQLSRILGGTHLCILAQVLASPFESGIGKFSCC